MASAKGREGSLVYIVAFITTRSAEGTLPLIHFKTLPAILEEAHTMREQDCKENEKDQIFVSLHVGLNRGRNRIASRAAVAAAEKNMRFFAMAGLSGAAEE